MELAYVHQGYTGERAEDDPEEHGIRLEVVKLPEAKEGFVLLAGRRLVERSFAWLPAFGRLARDYERLPENLGQPALRRLRGPDAAAPCCRPPDLETRLKSA